MGMRTTPLARMTSGHFPDEDRPLMPILADEANKPLDGLRAMRLIVTLCATASARVKAARLTGKRIDLPADGWVHVSQWSEQASYSDHSGLTVVPGDPAKPADVALAAFVAECLPVAFPGNKGNYAARGWRERSDTRYVWEDFCYGIGD